MKSIEECVDEIACAASFPSSTGTFPFHEPEIHLQTPCENHAGRHQNAGNPGEGTSGEGEKLEIRDWNWVKLAQQHRQLVV